ncbi:histidine kinase [Steroidobacter sp. S1-65]|uniref:Histidine kinase n=1 Tax=Steroidobacter gossypii TaxID=2805490 RepID=A0ABS1WSS6_9GAMM|nr:histidine kinase [Steroidobacter gossypii]MBM0104041.1 histidine kinase [Steroidobacter gossypii]
MDLAQLKQNRNLLFWSLHLLGWSAYGVSQYVGAMLYGKPVHYVQYIAVAATAGCILSAPLRYICRWLWKQPPATMIAGGLAAAYLTACALRVIMNWFYHTHVDTEWPIVHTAEYFSGALSSTYLLLCWMGLYFGVRYYESLQTERVATLQAAALAQEAQLKMLRYQLNPHFLFNTLNAISTLILDNRNSTANNAVTGLSEFLRYTLDQDPMKKVTVAQEVDALNLYLNIEKMRFGQRLRLNFAIEDGASQMLMPSLLLQPLIENAIKYAVSPREQGGEIRIGAHVTGGMLQLEVADDGPGMVDATRLANGRGVGIRNTRERLQVLYGGRGAVTVSNTDPGLRVSLSFPAERATTPA